MHARLLSIALGMFVVAGSATATRAQQPDSVATLPGVSVSAAPVLDRRLMEFERRREKGGGAFITSEQLKKDVSRPLAEAITLHIPSLVAVTRMSATESPLAKYIMARNGPKGGCYPEVYVDGAPVGSPSGASEISLFQTSDFAAIEYHTGANVPPQYNRATNMCGVILMWRKMR